MGGTILKNKTEYNNKEELHWEKADMAFAKSCTSQFY